MINSNLDTAYHNFAEENISANSSNFADMHHVPLNELPQDELRKLVAQMID